MRNLKRALSLVLATAMLIGMMVFGASAAGYKDSDTVNNDTAVEVLSALDIVGGDENGNFRPASTLTRAEFCVMIANVLTGGTFDKALFEGTATPFTDIQGHWGAPFIAFCYSSGVIAGTTATTFSPDANLTSAQAEAILLSVLGYNKNGEFAANDQFELNVTSWAQRVGLMENLTVAANAAITRDNTAQLMFNTLTRAVPVEYNDSFGVYYNALGRGTDWFAGVQFRYNETLGYTNFDLVYDKTSEDDFGRLGTEWGTGTVRALDDNGDISSVIVRQRITVQLNTPELSYTTTVKEREIYRALNLKKDNSLATYLDGVAQVNRNILDDKDKNLENSGIGVLTEVYKDGEGYRIVIIDTFLAQASSDYNAKNDKVNLTVYNYNSSTKTVGDGVSPDDDSVLSVKGEDIAAAMDLVQDDLVLVTIADGVIKTIADPEVLSSVTLNAFSRGKYVVTGGVTYDYAEAIEYDVANALPQYNYPNLKDVTYTLYLDPYGNLIGIELDQDPDQYLFITGYDVYSYATSTAIASANAIFLDGTMATISVNLDKSDFNGNADGKGEPWATSNALENTWYTYSVNEDDVYTITLVDNQAWSHYVGDEGGKINSNHPALSAVEGFEYDGTASPESVAYGNDDSVYIAAKTKNINYGGNKSAISGVKSTTTGIKNVDIDIATDAVSSNANNHVYTDGNYSTGVYALYNDKHYVIGAIVIGEDTGTKNEHLFYALGSVNREEYSDGSWVWSVDGILDGKETTLYERSDNLDYLSVFDRDYSTFERNCAYVVSNDSDGYVNANPYRPTLVDDFTELGQLPDNVEVTLSNAELTIRGWTLYLDVQDTNGVVVAADCPSALVEQNANGKFDATYFDDAQSAIKALDSSKIKDGKLVVSINKDRVITSLVVVVFNSEAPAPSTPSTPGAKYVVNWNQTADGRLQFTVDRVTGGASDASFQWKVTVNNGGSTIVADSGSAQLVRGYSTVTTNVKSGSNALSGVITVTFDEDTVVEQTFYIS